ncbi:hypothetical protein JCM3766R1_000303 [Sporobolomyces carnicolor]
MSSLPPQQPPCTEWHGLPQALHVDAICSVTSFSPASISIPESMILHPAGGSHKNKHPIIVSLIRHAPTGSFALFDLGLSRNWAQYAPKARLDDISSTYEPIVELEIDEVLNKIEVAPESIKFIIISHSHWDHCAHDFSRFPRAQVVVGPTALSNIAALSPEHYPSPDPRPLELSWAHSPTGVLTFRHSYDLFKDGSLLVVPTPGHTESHIAAVVRTSSDPGHEEFVVLAGDCAHHPLCLSVQPSDSHYRFSTWREPGEPTDGVAKHSMHEDYEEAERSLERLKALERRDEFMVVLAHDFQRWDSWAKTEHGTVELTGWRGKGLKR